MGCADKAFKTIVFIAFVLCLGMLCARFNASFGGKVAVIAFLAGIVGWAILYFGFYLLLSPLEFFTMAPAILYLTRVIGTPIAILWFVFWGTMLLGGATGSKSATNTVAEKPTPATTSAIQKAVAISSPAAQTYRVSGVGTNDFLNVHSGPATKLPSIGSLSRGAGNIRILGPPVKNGPDKWVKITDGNREGWVMAKFLEPE